MNRLIWSYTACPLIFEFSMTSIGETVFEIVCLTLKVAETKLVGFAISVNLDEVPHDEPPHGVVTTSMRRNDVISTSCAL